MKKVAFRTTVLMLLLVALTVATMSGCSINRLVAGLSKSMAQFNVDKPVGVATQTTVPDEPFATTEEPVVEVDADEEPEVEATTTTQQTTTKPAKTKPAVTKPPVTKPPTTKPPVTKPPTTKPPATTPANVVIIPLKYGVKQVETTTTKYYEDGRYQNIINVTFDRTGYSATTGDLLNEARANSNKYRAEMDAILKIANSYRATAGVAPVTLDNKLTEAAMVRACEMAWSGVHSHTRPNGSKYSTVFDECGISRNASGENIAMGYPTAQVVSEVWRDSPGHYNIIVNGKYSKIGIGVAVDQRGCYYWCQLFMA